MLVSLDYVPHKRVDVVKSHDDLAVAIWRSNSNIGHVPQEFSQVCWYFLQKSGSEITYSVVTGTKLDWVVRMCVCIFRGKPNADYSVR